MTCPRRFDVGVYVLGALDPPERESFDEHRRTCADCTAELRRFDGLPGLLARAPEPDLGEDPAPPTGLLDLATARARRARRRRRLLAVAAGVLLVLGGVLLGRSSTTSGATADPVRTVALESVQNAPVSGEAGLTARPWGTAISLRCLTRGRGAPDPGGPRPVYTLVVRSPDGSEQQVAQWSPPPGQDVDVQAATDLPPDEVRGMEVRNGVGQVVLRTS